MLTFSMSQSITIRGNWWLPNQPDKRVSGVLRFNPTQPVILELFGSFDDEKFPIVAVIIQGFTVTAKPITLYSCFELTRPQTSSNFGSNENSYFLSDYVVIGSSFASKEELVFESMYANFSNSEEWSWVGEYWFHKGEIITNPSELKLVEPRVEMDDCIIELYQRFPQSTDFTSIHIRQWTGFSIKPHKHEGFDAFLERINLLQMFLSFAIGRGTYPTKITAKRATSDEPISILHSVSHELLSIEKLNKYFMLFSLEDILSSFGTYLQNWFRLSPLLKPIYELYASILYFPQMFPEQKFLNLMQAIEALHRKTSNKFYTSEEDFKIILEHIEKSIPAEVDEKLRNRLVSSLTYANEFSLRHRFIDIWENYEITLSTRFPELKTYKAFTNQMVADRNLLTHYSKEIADRRELDDRLLDASIELRFILEVCLLATIEMPLEQVKEFANRNLYRRYHGTSIDLLARSKSEEPSNPIEI